MRQSFVGVYSYGIVSKRLRISAFTKQQHDTKSTERTQKACEHVALGVPHISLCAEEGVTDRTGEQRDPPLNELVKRGKAECHEDGDEIQPASGRYDLLFSLYFNLVEGGPSPSLQGDVNFKEWEKTNSS